MPDRPIALSCGEPSGIGPEIAARARMLLGASLPFFWIGDPSHLPQGTAHRVISSPAEAMAVPAGLLPVLRHDFPAAAQPGHPAPENAASVIAAIERGVSLVMRGEASALCTAPINKRH